MYQTQSCFSILLYISTLEIKYLQKKGCTLVCFLVYKNASLELTNYYNTELKQQVFLKLSCFCFSEIVFKKNISEFYISYLRTRLSRLSLQSWYTRRTLRRKKQNYRTNTSVQFSCKLFVYSLCVLLAPITANQIFIFFNFKFLLILSLCVPWGDSKYIPEGQVCQSNPLVL